MFAELIGQRLGNYRIVGKLGEGGIATVYRAEQLTIQREVAIKVLRTQDSEGDFLHRLEREAATIARLSHPHIVKLFDYGQENGITYLVMELITGGSLADLVRTGPLSPLEANRILQQLASALDYAHREGIIHRDLKPHNVLMDSNGNALLTDFGLARLVQATSILTQSGSIVGTPAYMAPEQWTGGIVDARTDVYALGVILFEMLTGKLPFNGETPYRMMHMHINEKPPYIHTLNTTIPLSFDAVISKALAKDIARRFDSAGALAAAFQSAALEQRTIVGPAEGIQETVTLPQTEERKPAPASSPRRKSLWLGAGFLAVLFILLGLLGLNYLGSQDIKAQPAVLAGSSGTSTMTPNVQTLAAATFAGRLTMTVSLLSQTPDEQKTLIAVVGATDTANAVASYTATATFTATSTLTPTLAITLTPIQATARSIADFAHVRTGPSLNNAILRQMAQGDTLPVIAKAEVGSELWYLLSLTNAAVPAGWVSSKEVELIPSDAVIATAATVPPSPVPSAWTPTPLPVTPTPTNFGGGNGNGSGSGSSGSGGGSKGGCVPIPLPPPLGHGC